MAMANRLLTKEEILKQLAVLDDTVGQEAGYEIGDMEIIRKIDGKSVRYCTTDLLMPIHEFSRRILWALVSQPREPTAFGIEIGPTSRPRGNYIALKNDFNKDPWHLAPWDAFRAIVKVMAFGAKKYEERNWEKGFDWHRLHRAAIEHLTSWWEGEDKDPETGYSHLWHAGCCVLFLISHEIRGIGKDDRPK
jgi:hypothetical protein